MVTPGHGDFVGSIVFRSVDVHTFHVHKKGEVDVTTALKYRDEGTTTSGDNCLVVPLRLTIGLRMGEAVQDPMYAEKPIEDAE